MQVTETLSSGLKREFQVVVTAADLGTEAAARLKDMAGRAQIKGFRPGKVPVDHLKRMYGKSVMAEVVQKKIDDSSREVFAGRNLKPAYQPEVKLPEGEAEVNAVMDGKADLSFSISAEVIPTFDLVEAGGLTLSKHTVAASDEHINEALGRLSSQYKDWETRAEGAAAEKGDRVTINFLGKIDGVAFDGGAGDSIPLEIGSGQFIPGFEDQLIGAKVGDDKVVNVTFPENYGAKELAGKAAAFETTVTAIDCAKSTAIDDDFAKKLGFETLSAMKDMVKGGLEREFGQMTAMKLKRDVLDALDKQYAFELPQKLVEAEYNGIWNTLSQEMTRANRSFADEGTTEDEARKEYRAIAERRVRLGLVLGTMGEKEGIAVTEQELQQALLARVRRFPGQEQQVYDYYRKNPSSLIELRGPIFEQKVVDLIVSRATVADKAVTREELKAMVEEDMDGDEDTSV
jgi:trigger factor